MSVPAMSPLRRSLHDYVEARQSAMNEARRALGLNELDARALLFIAENPGARPTLVREYLGITSAGVTTLIDRLVQKGAVRRDLDEVDRRVNHITVTVDLYAEPWSVLTRFDTAIDEAIGGIGSADARRFADALTRLTAAATVRD